MSSRHLASPATPPVTPAVKIPQGRAFREGNRILLAHSFEPSCHRQRWPGGLEQKIILRALHTQRFNDRHPKEPPARTLRCSIALTQPAGTDILLALGRDEVIE